MEEVSKTTRRSFLGGLGVLAVAGAARKLSPAPSVASDATSPQTEPEGNSYRLTEHIKKYYRTTTI
jgi:hypothetical protein